MDKNITPTIIKIASLNIFVQNEDASFSFSLCFSLSLSFSRPRVTILIFNIDNILIVYVNRIKYVLSVVKSE